MVPHPLTGRRCWFNQIAFLSEWTMAPELREYLMDVYGADMASIVNKFVGETEKNLSLLLSRAEELDVLLLIDEGDSFRRRLLAAVDAR